MSGVIALGRCFVESQGKRSRCLDRGGLAEGLAGLRTANCIVGIKVHVAGRKRME